MPPTSPVIRLADYQPPAWTVQRVDLEFELDFDRTVVRSRLQLRRRADAAAAPIELHGEDVQTRWVRLDGRLLAPNEYVIQAGRLCLDVLADEAQLESEVVIKPARNTRLEGLYRSGSFLTTQCEAEGFRRITWFPDRPDVMAVYSVRLIADPEQFPVLLSNGNPGAVTSRDDGRIQADWHDPWPKPSYLFAVVAGQLQYIEDHYRTSEGRDVRLRIYAEAPAIGRCRHAMDSLKRAMRFDEEEFGRAYDLDVYNIVATYDFNMGAMENKGLNIFNAKAIVADDDTATDADLDYVEAVVAHEYFHNWTGNRITCRDWFQLSLKEGLTVYRDQVFSAAQGSAAVKRIDDVRQLRSLQFPEDGGPFAHPVQPAEYTEINNFYTATVYDKGAEVVRMYHTLLGAECFRRGMDLYFQRHDGQAVTCDDFRAAIADANGVDLSAMRRWYDQAGTPRLHAEVQHDAATQTLHLRLRQQTPATPGQSDKLPLPIPVRLMLYDQDGAPRPLRLVTEAASAVATQRVLCFDQIESVFVFADIDAPVVPSLMQGFSAPVLLSINSAVADLAFRIRHDRDDFNRYDAAQSLAERLLIAAYRGAPDEAAEAAYLDALGDLLRQESIDPALRAECLQLPDEAHLGERFEALDPVRLAEARRDLAARLGQALQVELRRQLHSLHATAAGTGAIAAATRRLRGRALQLLMAADAPAHAELAQREYQQGRSMGERLLALTVLVHHAIPGARAASEAFYQRHADDPLLIDKWLSLQASNPQPGTIERVRALLEHPAFNRRNPNKVRALLGVFARQNRSCFHESSGAGYRLLGGELAVLDAINPQIAARLIAAFNGWRRLEPQRRALMRQELERLAAVVGLSRDSAEIIGRALAG